MFKIRFRSFRFWILSLSAVLVQSSLLHIVSIRGVVPHIALLCGIFFSVHQGPRRGLAAGLGLGAMMDLLSAGIGGINILLLGTIGLATGCLRGRVYTTHPATRFLVAAGAVVAYNAGYYILALQFHQLPPLADSMRQVWLHVAYTATANLFLAAWLEQIVIEKIFTLP